MKTPAPLSCPKCRADLPVPLGLPGAPTVCPACARPVEGLVFDAYHRPPAVGKTAEALVSTEDAGCFYHPSSRAQVPCDICGRFLCALCDVELQGQHLCPACLNTGARKKRVRNLDSDRLIYGGLASMLAILPIILFWPLTIITGPLAIFIAIYGWKKPRSLVSGGGTASFVIAILIGLLQVLAWIAVFVGLNMS
jgi:hypothetical protein